MATGSELVASQQQLINSLAQEDIPIKLRCAICSKLAVDAFRLPCCDQSICERCHSTLPSSCPVCEHSPLSADDCKPNKALRTTIKVFLRTAEKKREIAKAAAAPLPEPSPVELPTKPSQPSVTEVPEIAIRTNESVQTEAVEEIEYEPAESAAIESKISSDAQEDIPHPSIENIDKGQELDEPKQEKADAAADESGATEPSKVVEGGDASAEGANAQNNQVMGSDGQWINLSLPGQQQMPSGMAFGMNGAAFGYGNNQWNGQAGFDPMMQPMQNGFMNGGWGAFPNMMGMPGMNMDPMSMSQGMYAGYGQAMGINGMSMAGGMGFGAGEGGFAGWNGRQGGWNGGQQDKFNPNAHGGNASGMGDYGSTLGYPQYQQSATGGYNQMDQQQRVQSTQFQSGVGFQGQGYASRGGQFRGRGAGSFHTGRGGYGQVLHGGNNSFQQHTPGQATLAQSDQHQVFTKGDDVDAAGGHDSGALAAAAAKDGGVDEMVGEHDDSVAKQDSVAIATQTGVLSTGRDGITAEDGQHSTRGTGNENHNSTIPAANVAGTTTSALASANDIHQPPTGPAALMAGNNLRDFNIRGRGAFAARGVFRGNLAGFRGGRGGAGIWPNGNAINHPGIAQPGKFPMVSPVEPRGLGVVGAPKAPKALREGLPNTGIRGRGLAIMGRGGISANGGHLAGSQTQSLEKARSRSPEQDRSRSRSLSSRSHHSRHGRHHRRGSQSPSGGESDRAQGRDHRRRRSHHKTGATSVDDDAEELTNTRKPSRDASAGRSKSRSRSPHSSRRPSHRSRDEESRKSSHRSRRERSRERDRDRDRRHRRRHSRNRSRSPKGDVEDTNENDAYSASASDRRQRQSSHKQQDRDGDRKSSRRDRTPSLPPQEGRRPSHHSEGGRKQPSARPAAVNEVNSHDLEREARNRERLQREQQRIAELNGESHRKNRDGKREGDEDDPPSRSSKRRRHKSGGDGEIEIKGRGGRRHSYKYGEHGGDEARAARVEQEREAARWG